MDPRDDGVGGRPRAVAEVAADLRTLGVATGDLLMVHASLRAVGPVTGGAAGVLAALEQAVGPAGTLLLNVGAAESDEPFDVLATPADPDVGVLAEVVRCTPGTLCNDHPDARFAARGPLAGELLSALPWDDYYGAGSLLERFAERGGRVLRLGADEDTVTLLHLAEHRARLPAKRRVTRRHRLRRVGGDVVEREVTTLDDSDGVVDRPGEDYFALLLRAHLATGAARTGVVGGARSELLESGPLLVGAVAWLEAELPRWA